MTHRIPGYLVELGRRLREERVKSTLNQPDFAARVGVSKTSQQQYEAGKTPPTVEYLYRLADHGIDPGYILTGQRDGGSLGLLETHLIEAFRAMGNQQRQALLQVADALRQDPQKGRDDED